MQGKKDKKEGVADKKAGKELIPIPRAISNKQFSETKFEKAAFTGEWLLSFGEPALQGVWFIFGKSGSGKTTFTLMLCKYLTQFGHVAYNSLEQGTSPSLQIPWNRVGLPEVGRKILLLERLQLKALRAYLRKRQSPDIIVIDSVRYLFGFKVSDYFALKVEFPDKLFIFIGHEKAGAPDLAIAEAIYLDADVKIRTEGYKAFITTRFGHSGSDFVIWDKGAAEYWADAL